MVTSTALRVTRERQVFLELFLDPPQLGRRGLAGLADPAQFVQERLAREQYLAAGCLAGHEPGEQVQRAAPQIRRRVPDARLEDLDGGSGGVLAAVRSLCRMRFLPPLVRRALPLDHAQRRER